jgi:hypothetical protein
MKFAHAVGWLNTRILLTIVFLIVIGLPALVMKLLRRDPLDRRFRDRESYWKERLHEAQSLEAGRHQF